MYRRGPGQGLESPACTSVSQPVKCGCNSSRLNRVGDCSELRHGRILGSTPKREPCVRAGCYHQDTGKMGEGTVPQAAKENLPHFFFFFFLQFCLKVTGERHYFKYLMKCLEQWRLVHSGTHWGRLESIWPLSSLLTVKKEARPAHTQIHTVWLCHMKSKDSRKDTLVTEVRRSRPRNRGWWELSGKGPEGAFWGDAVFSISPWMVITWAYT